MIAPGDWVECLHGAFLYDTIVTGQLYCVEDVMRKLPCDYCGKQHQTLVLTSDRSKASGWCPSRFRPIYRPKSELLESLLTTSPILEPAQP